MKILILPVFLAINLFAIAPSDFAYKSTIDTSKEHGLVTFELPLFVYEKSTTSHLNDIAVFDANKRQMPQNIITPQTVHSNMETIALPFKRFEVIKKENREQVTLTYDKKTIALTALKDINNSDYLVDASNMRAGIDYLQILSDDAEYMVKTDITYSNNLKDWHLAAQGEVLAKMQMQGSRLLKERITLHTPPENFLMIHTRSPININKIIAYKQRIKAQQPTLTQLTYTRAQNKGEPVIDFELPPTLRLDTLHIELPRGEQFYHFKFLRRHQTDASWELFTSSEFYRLQNNRLVKDTITLNSRARYYRIEASQGFYLPKKLQLFFTYQHKKLTFMAQGTPPYTLYYGSLKAKVPNTNLGTRFTILNATVQAPHLVNPQALELDKKPRDKRAILVWISLIIGVMVLGLVSYKLLKEIKEK